jgi:clan AA aspartic protease
MGTFTVSVEVGDMRGRRFVRVEALVDTGASHSVLPRPVLEGLGVAPVHRVPFRLADERRVEYDVGPALVRLSGLEMPAMGVFGGPDATPLLGATTLELFNLGVDPVGQRLVPVEGLLMPAVQQCLSPASGYLSSGL